MVPFGIEIQIAQLIPDGLYRNKLLLPKLIPKGSHVPSTMLSFMMFDPEGVAC